jgi:hypothetical protein
LTGFWVAVWVLDFEYYNRLLIGAVNSLLALETASKSSARLKGISLSTDIHNAVINPGTSSTVEARNLSKGPRRFYTIVLVLLVLGTLGSVVLAVEKVGESQTVTATPKNGPNQAIPKPLPKTT